MGIRSIFTDIKYIIYFLVFVAFVIYYIFYPSDIIPDSLGLIGYIDDFSLVGGITVWVIERFFLGFRNRVARDYADLISQ